MYYVTYAIYNMYLYINANIDPIKMVYLLFLAVVCRQYK
jgi:hypothetical protein